MEASDSLVSSAPLVTVFDNNPIDSIVKKPSEEDMCAAKMQWIEGVPHNKLEKVYMSAVFDESMFKKLKEKTNSRSALSAEIQKYDAGLLFYVDNQTRGEVGLHVFLRDTHTGEVFGHYTARIEYNEDKGIEGKKAALVYGVKRFAREFDRFRNGERAVSEEIYQVR